jgi:DNA-binding NarL/FixJ family response regulator
MADDHKLLRKALASLIESLGDFKVIAQAGNGIELLKVLKAGIRPEIVLLDVNMPQMDGFETALQLKKYFPDIKVLALSMIDSKDAVLHMIKNGARGYLLKDAEPDELKKALLGVSETGYYFSTLV